MNGAYGNQQERGKSEGRPHEPAGGATSPPGSLYLRATLSQWQHSHRELGQRFDGPRQGGDAADHTAAHAALLAAAIHAVLARLRACVDPTTLVERYDADPSDDFALIASLLPYDPDGATGDLYALSRVREAAFWLRWVELADPAKLAELAASEPPGRSGRRPARGAKEARRA